jgi:RNA-directed DNA polymerase
MIGHSFIPLGEKKPGLEFLGFYSRNVKCSYHRGVKNTRGKNQPFQVVTMPSRASVNKHKKRLKAVLYEYKSAPLEKVIERLSQTIRGWTGYHSITQCTKAFSAIDG